MSRLRLAVAVPGAALLALGMGALPANAKAIGATDSGASQACVSGSSARLAKGSHAADPNSAARASRAATWARRRSTRSTITPATRPNSSHGSQVAAVSAAISIGELVSDSASSGASVPRMPSPRLASPVEASCTPKGRPS